MPTSERPSQESSRPDFTNNLERIGNDEMVQAILGPLGEKPVDFIRQHLVGERQEQLKNGVIKIAGAVGKTSSESQAVADKLFDNSTRTWNGYRKAENTSSGFIGKVIYKMNEANQPSQEYEITSKASLKEFLIDNLPYLDEQHDVIEIQELKDFLKIQARENPARDNKVAQNVGRFFIGREVVSALAGLAAFGLLQSTHIDTYMSEGATNTVIGGAGVEMQHNEKGGKIFPGEPGFDASEAVKQNQTVNTVQKPLQGFIVVGEAGVSGAVGLGAYFGLRTLAKRKERNKGGTEEPVQMEATIEEPSDTPRVDLSGDAVDTQATVVPDNVIVLPPSAVRRPPQDS